MDLRVEEIKKMIATGDTGATLLALASIVGAFPAFIKDEFHWLAARWHGLQKQLQSPELAEMDRILETLDLHEQLQQLVNEIEQHARSNTSSLPDVFFANPGEDKEAIHLIFYSAKKGIRQPVQISPYEKVGFLKNALIRQFDIDIRAPLDSDNPEAYLVVNRTPLMNDHLSLLEAGIKNRDMIQINVQYHKKMVWSQAMPTRIHVTFVGLTFTKPKVIVNNLQKGKLISLTKDELEVEFYTYNFSKTLKNLLFNFRFIDGTSCLEFQEVVNEKGKTIDLQKISKQLAGNMGY